MATCAATRVTARHWEPIRDYSSLWCPCINSYSSWQYSSAAPLVGTPSGGQGVVTTDRMFYYTWLGLNRVHGGDVRATYIQLRKSARGLSPMKHLTRKSSRITIVLLRHVLEEQNWLNWARKSAQEFCDSGFAKYFTTTKTSSNQRKFSFFLFFLPLLSLGDSSREKRQGLCEEPKEKVQVCETEQGKKTIREREKTMRKIHESRDPAKEAEDDK